MVGVAPVCVKSSEFLVAGHLSPDYDGHILGLVVPPVVTPWVRSAGPFGVRLGVARCHTKNWLAAALEGLIRIVGSGAAQADNPPRER